ncbi:metallophosphoesterase family protein [Tautonia plasticadhaerens]|uniref:Putative metallophosphoesterase YhaO n=1 Tax=Tautonia plasticadhaerens TaxID=2527974 RepID=A0A518H933_9BACT|nr:DNA repair exonuclease [Tautonia plasticadhaerens]QDV37353.1 putative metallophosphoesterase YhaO [Tautonia plasticadhaerens]
MPRFLHAADIHLDSPMCGLERYDGAPIDRIRTGTRRALERLVNLAIEQRVDFVLIAGDLYDGDWRDYNTGLFLRRTLGRLSEAGIPVYIIAGNHDAENRMTRSLSMPEGVKLLATDRPETVRVDSLDVAVHGQGFATPAVTIDLSASYPDPVRGCLNVGMLHTCVAGAEGHERYAPCAVDGLRAKGYDYWALGHIHLRHEVHDDPPIAFPGNLQGRHVRETGPKGCLIVDLEPGQGARSTFHRLDVMRWEVLDLDASGLSHPDDLLGRAAQAFREIIDLEDDPDRLIAVRVRVLGASAWHDRFMADGGRWINEIRAQGLDAGGDRLWVERVKLATRPPTRPDDDGGDGPIDALMRLVDSYRADDDRLRELAGRLSELRRKLPPEFSSGDDAVCLDDPDWLREMLDRVGPMLIHRLRAAREPLS